MDSREIALDYCPKAAGSKAKSYLLHDLNQLVTQKERWTWRSELIHLRKPKQDPLCLNYPWKMLVSLLLSSAVTDSGMSPSNLF